MRRFILLLLLFFRAWALEEADGSKDVKLLRSDDIQEETIRNKQQDAERRTDVAKKKTEYHVVEKEEDQVMNDENGGERAEPFKVNQDDKTNSSDGGGRGNNSEIVSETYLKDGKFKNFLKCCPQGNILFSPGYCKNEIDEQVDWSSQNSSIAGFLTLDVVYNKTVLRRPLCKVSSYYLEESPSAETFHSALVNGMYQDRFFTKFYCVDFLRRSDNTVSKTLAFWTVPSYGPVYQDMRPLQVVAAVLLALAVAAAACKGDTRRSTHGRALACHAACLLGANALQASWFFTHEAGKDCHYYAYAIYFFLVSGGFWLNVISINMAREFRLLQEKGEVCDDWKFFGFFSLYAWGTSGTLTAFTISMYTARRYMHLMEYQTPSFMETRTCLPESLYSEIAGEQVYDNPKIGALLYFYVPSMILMIVNIVCLILTLLKIKHLGKDSSVLNTPRILQRALLYVKLLLAAGVLEQVLAATTWAAKHCQPLTNDGETPYASNDLDSASRLAVIMTLVDVGRAGVVLWLCVGQWGDAARLVRGRLRALRWLVRWRRDSFSSPAGAPAVSFYNEDTKL